MKAKLSLRFRVALTFLMATVLISLTIASFVYWLTINRETDLIEEVLTAELESYMNRYAEEPNARPPSSTYIKTYVSSNANHQALPDELRLLQPGFSHVTIDQKGYYVVLNQHNTTSFFVLYADQPLKQGKRQWFQFLFLVTALIIPLSTALGLWLAVRVTSRVTQLTKQISSMKPGFNPLVSERTVPLDEVDELALAINNYQQRLTRINQRERAFTGDVSHELRSSLAVIEGATEVMISSRTLSTDNQARVLRIARATTQITNLTTALLILAREDSTPQKKHHCEVARVLKNVVSDHQYLLSHKQVEVKLSVDDSVHIYCDPTLLYVVLANIIRNAFSYTHKGIIQIQLEKHRVIVNDTGNGMSKKHVATLFKDRYHTPHTQNGNGIGLSLANRICERYRWKISVRSIKDRGTWVELLLTPPQIPQKKHEH